MMNPMQFIIKEDNEDEDSIYIHKNNNKNNNNKLRRSDGLIELQTIDDESAAATKSAPLLAEAPMVLLQMPDEWFDLNKRLPTDKEFHQWVRHQIRRENVQRRRGGRRNNNVFSLEEEKSSGSFDNDNDDEDDTTKELLSAFGDAIKEVSANIVQGIKIRQEEERIRKDMLLSFHSDNGPDVLLDERPGFVLHNFDGDCFGSNNNKTRRRAESVVGMELPVMS
eukprot:CAMPEP_0117025298 /NCGR_PEP_ID=MMETSP0472-20121206/18702_1 /TAXON_ID=693140 ORGANISM="Tiarina fusus, Strain LIS" /NCGR_SAMPLE_ID=MMETSP0472 /ASSEMBLY_ACC=CAM_ASM_000603 /LENGTH=222 /DNA_ID=CAMNT_0004731975 /DNA_START=117 /DNA_END=785 /DNA_ORIENTATION=-